MTFYHVVLDGFEYVSDNEIEDGGAKAFSEALMVNTSLRKLYLCCKCE